MPFFTAVAWYFLFQKVPLAVKKCSPIRCMVKYGGVEPVESVAQRFAEETGLKLKFAMMWLEEAGVDYERALKEFEEAKAEGKISPEGFEEK